MRVKHTVTPIITEDTLGLDIVLSEGAAALTVLDGFTTYKTGAKDYAADAGEFALALEVSVPKGIYLRSTGDFNLKVNGSQAIQIRRGFVSAGVKAAAAAFFMEGDLSAIAITPVEAMRLRWAVWGDLAT